MTAREGNMGNCHPQTPTSTSASPRSTLVFSGWQFPMLSCRAVNIYIIYTSRLGVLQVNCIYSHIFYLQPQLKSRIICMYLNLLKVWLAWNLRGVLEVSGKYNDKLFTNNVWNSYSTIYRLKLIFPIKHWRSVWSF